MIQRWTNAQVHDTVAAIVRESGYRAQRESLVARFFHYVFDKISDFLRLIRGSIDAKLIIAAAIAVLVAAISIRIIIDRRAAERRARLAGPGRSANGRRDAWAESRTLADAGKFVDASHALYSAVIDSLTSMNVLRFHRSKTAGDYARDLRRAGSPLAADFRVFGREFDRVAFGRDAVTREDYERLVTLAQRVIGASAQSSAA